MVSHQTSRHHVPALDGVRGLAILGVLLCHFVPALADAFDTSWARRLVPYAGPGGWGVDLFFVLSGFLITGILLDTRDSRDYWRSFFGRRVLRIFPLYYTFLIGLYLTNRPSGEAWKFWLHLSNWRSDLGISSNIFTWHFWSLAIEEQFYLVWPIVVAVLPVRRLGLMCLTMAAGSATLRGIAASAGADIETLHRMTPLALDGLAIGSYLAWAIRFRPEWRDRLSRLALPAFVASAVAFWTAERLNLPYASFMVVGRVIVSVGGGAVVLLAVSGPPLVTRCLIIRPLCVLGQYCYGLYLLHPLVVVNGMEPARWLASHVPKHLSLLAWMLALATGVTAALGLAAVSWRLLESPCLSLKRFFPYRPASTAILPQPHTPLVPAGRRGQAAGNTIDGVPGSSGRMEDQS